MTTLVTGAGGFIGSAVVRQLVGRRRHVRAMVEPGADRGNLAGLPIEIVPGDVTDRASVEAAMRGCTAVYHLAAIYALWARDDRRIYEVNVEGTKNVLFAARRAGVRRVVHTSSIAAIGFADDGGLADELTPFTHWRDADAYVRSKYLSDLDAQRLAADGVPVVIVCPAFPFGEGDRAPTPTGRFIVEALQRRVPGIPSRGGFCVADVDDIAAFHLVAEDKGQVGERYIAGAHNVTYEDFYRVVTEVAGLPPIRRRLPGAALGAIGWFEERVADLTGRAPRITVKAARFAQRNAFYQCRKARALGLAETPLAETVAKAIHWFRRHGYAP